MSRYSIRVGDKREDLFFRHRRPLGDGTFSYVLYVGDRPWGSVFDMGYGWTAVANIPGNLNLVEGFRRRMDAAWYIIGYVKEHSRA